MAKNFLLQLKPGRIKRKAYAARDDVRQGFVDRIKMFYNPKRCQEFNDKLPHVKFERWHFGLLTAISQIWAIYTHIPPATPSYELQLNRATANFQKRIDLVSPPNTMPSSTPAKSRSPKKT